MVLQRTKGVGVYENLISVDLVTTNIVEGGSASIHTLYSETQTLMMNWCQVARGEDEKWQCDKVR